MTWSLWLILFAVGLAVTVFLLRMQPRPLHLVQPVPKQPGKVVYYRTRDGLADYGFSFEQGSGGLYRVYIVSQPPYGSRDAGVHSTHRLIDGRRYYICWTGPLHTEEQARRVAALWADNTQRYIQTGWRF